MQSNDQPRPRDQSSFHAAGHLSAYLAGIGATGALTAGAVVVFLSLATFVAFRGLPSLAGSSDSTGPPI